ncbi:uncharacterized protein EI97DRAFT_300204 [Westerdykella ornata]|uniref:Protein kinase domain-containing protein n=1 Tax=Westerdykella ornata TaxID=318751 RepID=A0A6A6JMB9_WESOR|nr:uncharacterized protein EI97DRAFT_300204 [Westerdykella ornata]KAF2277642.1 hypothetical protein EI97DRAFT_300204 [Westerdykella ornata]
MSPKPISFAYRFEDGCAMNIDYQRHEYRICWNGDWRKPPDLSHFPAVDGSVTLIPHSREVEELWAKSDVLKCGADAHIRILKNKKDAFPVIKVGMDDRQRRLIADEFSILCYLASHGCPVVRVHSEPFVDDKGIFGFRMEELFEIEIASGRTHAAQILSSIKKIHEVGVIHNDLSPNNLMKNREGCLTLIDFGHAGYLGDQIPSDMRAPNSNCDRYSVEHDMNAVKRVLDIYGRNGFVQFIPRSKLSSLSSLM